MGLVDSKLNVEYQHLSPLKCYLSSPQGVFIRPNKNVVSVLINTTLLEKSL